MVPYCEAMVAPPSGCARDDCCERQPADGADSPEAIAESVVVQMLEQHIEAPPLPRHLSLFWMSSNHVPPAIEAALVAALPDVSLRVASTPPIAGDWTWVHRYQVVRDDGTPVLDFLLGGGLCVVTTNSGSRILQSLITPRRYAGRLGCGA